MSKASGPTTFRPTILDDFAARTLLARDFHQATSGLVGDIYHVKGKQWNWVQHEVDFAKNDAPLWASMGCSKARENLLFDANSPRLQQLREEVILQTSALGDSSIANVLKTVNRMVNALTAIPGKLSSERERELDGELNAFLSSRTDLNITIDELIARKILVCRHKALIVAYLLGELVRLGMLPAGEVRHYRSELRALAYETSTTATKSRGVHTWAIYVNNDNIWMCDPRWQNVINTSSADGLCVAGKQYGVPTIINMLEVLGSSETPSKLEVDALVPTPAFLPMAAPLIQGVPSASPVIYDPAQDDLFQWLQSAAKIS
ncbi:hypothetical protein [Candidatus Berkiella aquae]|uniref:Uncharacterized protein n=1 Tax=Candidatus Berkiella aquae TaxID=295108 RepID=A0A0Q9YUM1_9GAMM|nr:hypothetical protein [Candidatus Berkiella aquae]MCS5712327.1 hypothetical protein [Candidatus Berkiella aquae]